jgi:hypothetical protein
MLVQRFAQCHALKSMLAPAGRFRPPQEMREGFAAQLSPGTLRRVDDQLQLGPLLILGEGVAPRARWQSRTARRGPTDPAGSGARPPRCTAASCLVLRLRGFSGHQTEHHALALRDRTQGARNRRRPRLSYSSRNTSTGVSLKSFVRHRLVAARGHPAAAEVAAAQVHCPWSCRPAGPPERAR